MYFSMFPGPTHRSHRKVIMPMLNNKALNEYVEHFDFHSRICADLLDEKVDSETPFDIQPYLIHCTFDMIFGKCFKQFQIQKIP